MKKELTVLTRARAARRATAAKAEQAKLFQENFGLMPVFTFTAKPLKAQPTK